VNPLERATTQASKPTIQLVALSFFLWSLAAGTSLADGVTPTTEWINLYSTNSTLDGEPVPVGTSIAVFDSEGTKCGEGTVSREGWYRLLPCYRDDPTTPGDEGAVPGDVLYFAVGGEPAAATALGHNGTAISPSAQVTWTVQGDRWEVDLHGASSSAAVGGHTLSLNSAVPTDLWRTMLSAVALGLALSVAAALTRRGHTERWLPNSGSSSEDSDH